MIKKKTGSSAATSPLIILISVMIIVMFTIFVINSIVPFIFYEKLQLIAHKYMYVIEKYGYLTNNEKLTLENELVLGGFKKENLTIIAPNVKKSYGELIELKITYLYEQKIPTWEGVISFTNNNIPMQVKKVSVSKV